MNKSNAFYYLESAPQILSAYKQIKQDGIENYKMLVRLNGSHHNDMQIQQVLQDLGIRKYGHVSSCLLGVSFFFAFLKLIILSRYTDFCIGDIRSPIGLCAIVLARCKRIILLDDGTASFSYYIRRAEHVEVTTNGLVKRVLTKLAAEKLKCITLHTMLPLKSTTGMMVEINNYKIHPAGIHGNAVIKERQAVFIGSKVVEAEICSMRHFDAVMKRFVEDFKGYQLIYIPHREEEIEKLQKFPKIEILRLSRPLELEFGLVRSIPAVVCTFYSAGIINFLPYKDSILLQSYDIPIEAYNFQYHQSLIESKVLFNNFFGISICSLPLD